MNKIMKSLPLTTILLAASCSPSTQQVEVKTKPEVQKPEPTTRYDCSSLDLTQKVGFFVSFTLVGK